MHALSNWHVVEKGQGRNATGVALKKEDAVGIGEPMLGTSYLPTIQALFGGSNC